ncbi:MAG: DUF533 domain-containing protein [Myxococcales bacterium]|nr:DUF533 domain-containing protein [Myxococcales bacterium]
MARFTRTRTWLITLLRAVRRRDAPIPPPLADAAAFEAWLKGELATRGFLRGMPADVLQGLALGDEARYDEYPLVNTIAHQLQIGEALIGRRRLSDAGERHARLLLAGLACAVDRPDLVEQAWRLLELTPEEVDAPDGLRALGGLARALGEALVAGDLGADHPLLGHPFHLLVRYQDALLFGRIMWEVIEGLDQPGGHPAQDGLLRAAGRHTNALQHAISAATMLMAADGIVDAEERRLLSTLVRTARLSETAQAMFEAELVRPVTPAEIAAAVTDPEERQAILRLLFLAAHVNGVYNPPEKALLDELAARFGVSDAEFTRYEVEALVGYQQHAGLLDKLSFSSGIQRMRRRAFERAEDFIRDNAARIWGEIRETSELGQLLIKAGQEGLDDDERRRVRDQLLDLARAMPALALFALPGGSVLLPILIKHLPFNILPSSYLDDQAIDDGPQPASTAPRSIPPPASAPPASGEAASGAAMSGDGAAMSGDGAAMSGAGAAMSGAGAAMSGDGAAMSGSGASASAGGAPRSRGM